MGDKVDDPKAWVNGDIIVNGCTFKDCQSEYGGAIFSHDGTQQGDEETNITNCVFEHCSSKSGGCIYSRSYKNTISHCKFMNNDNNKIEESTILYIVMNEEGIAPVIFNCSFTNNINQYFHMNINSFLVFDFCSFSNIVNEHDGGAIQINSDFNSSSLEFANCNFSDIKSNSINGGAVAILPDNNCPKLVFRGCCFTDLSSKKGGAILISDNSQSSLHIKDNEETNIYYWFIIYKL